MARYRNFDGTLGAGTDTHVLHPALDDVRSRRAGLKAALSGLELALAAPYANRVDWVTHVREALDAVHDVWTRHIVETEAPGAFLDDLVREAPRLSTPTSRLRRDHSDILATIVREEERSGAPPEADDGYDTWAEEATRRAHCAPRRPGPPPPTRRRPGVRGLRRRSRRRLLDRRVFVVFVQGFAAAEAGRDADDGR